MSDVGGFDLSELAQPEDPSIDPADDQRDSARDSWRGAVATEQAELDMLSTTYREVD